MKRSAALATWLALVVVALLAWGAAGDVGGLFGRMFGRIASELIFDRPSRIQGSELSDLKARTRDVRRKAIEREPVLRTLIVRDRRLREPFSRMILQLAEAHASDDEVFATSARWSAKHISGHFVKLLATTNDEAISSWLAHMVAVLRAAKEVGSAACAELLTQGATSETLAVLRSEPALVEGILAGMKAVVLDGSRARRRLPDPAEGDARVNELLDEVSSKHGAAVLTGFSETATASQKCEAGLAFWTYPSDEPRADVRVRPG